MYTGECELIHGKIGGITVSIRSSVAATAGASEVRVSQTVKDLVAGSGPTFEDAGEHGPSSDRIPVQRLQKRARAGLGGDSSEHDGAAGHFHARDDMSTRPGARRLRPGPSTWSFVGGSKG